MTQRKKERKKERNKQRKQKQMNTLQINDINKI